MSLRVPFGDLSAEVREIRAEIDVAIAAVLDSGWFVLGKQLELFEGEFAGWLGAGHAVGCGNGTDAITLALKALGLGAGDEVITVANTCVPTAAGIRDAGCMLRLVDCDPQTLQMDASGLASAISPATRAVVVVHLYGSCPNMTQIHAICHSRGVPLIEDCAQAHGARCAGRPAGRWGRLSCWSFYPSKNLGAYGDGGAVATDEPALAERLKRLRNYGQRERYFHDDEGRNSRLDELQAGILRVKLRHLARWNDRRRAIADRYIAAFAGSIISVPQVAAECVSARHLFPIRVPATLRDRLREQLQTSGVSTQIHYPVPLHRQKAYAHLFPAAHFPNAETAAAELLTLPLFPQMTDEQVTLTADTVVAKARELRQP